ncbi:MAG: ParA family protein [Clostridia bacterium]|nr:ParA family protein [Clostridia bacterium]
MKIIIVCGHYGVGKTNFSLNLALSLKGKTALCDMDVVNPYFRSGDYAEFLKNRGIDVVAPVALGTTVDAPFISPKVKALFCGDYDTVIFDAGGDDAGATALGQFSNDIKNVGYEMLYVINKYREQTTSPEAPVEILREIETASRLKATALCNNSHLCDETTSDIVRDALPFAEEVSKITGLPIKYTVIREDLVKDFPDVPNVFPVSRMVLPPW